MPMSLVPRRRGRSIAIAAVSFIAVIAISLLLMTLVVWDEQPTLIVVRSVPKGASVVLNGKNIEHPTPVIIPVEDPSAPQKIEVSLTNYKTWTASAKVQQGENRLFLAVLTAETGSLHLESVPPKAHVYINEEHRGKTPIDIPDLSLTEPVSYELRKRGFKNHAETLRWAGKRKLRAKVKLKRAR